MSFLKELEWRGLVQDVSDREGIEALGKGVSFYVGFDPTALSLQVGNLVPLMAAVHIARSGLKPLILFGGATGAIGDPSGKNKERKLLSRDEIDQNIARQVSQATALFERIQAPVEFVNNYDWTKDITVLEFLRDIGKHFTVNYMLAKEAVKTRIAESGISFTEFSYMVLQGFDFWYLYNNRNCRLQIGGSDQWGNITAGLELIRRKSEAEEHGALALSVPLITDSQGRKFGKSEQGAIWLDAEMTSPYRFHQFWLNISDDDVIRYLKIFTLLEQGDIQKLKSSLESNPEQREAQHILADEVCTLVHGEEATKDAQRSAQVLFGGSLEGLSQKQLEEIFYDVPSASIRRSDAQGSLFLDIMVSSGAVKSRGEAKRLVTNGGAYLNNERVSDIQLKLESTDVLEGSLFVIRTGKKNYHLIKLTDG